MRRWLGWAVSAVILPVGVARGIIWLRKRRERR